MAVAILLLSALRAESAFAGTIAVEVANGRGEPVENAVAYAYPANGKAPIAEVKPAIVDQVDREFLPEVSVIPVNTPVTFPNSDKIRHHVYSLSKTKSFDLPLYLGTPAKPVVFDNTGVAVVGCNIHDWMIAYIFVVDTPYFAKTDAHGKAVLEGLAEGKYTIAVWHPRIKADARETFKSATADGGAGVRFEITLKPDWRIRRSPVISGGGGY